MFAKCSSVPMALDKSPTAISDGEPAPAGEGRLRLASGGRLAFRCYGPADGRPILYLHGFASSRLEPAMAAELLPRFGARIVAFDRPGYGGSDPLPGGDVRAVAALLLEGMTRIGLDRTALCGVSAGAPYALAMASLAPGRVRRLALLSG